jgi:putative membrane protein insertion efficiency factor
MRRVLLGLIGLYRRTALARSPRCRFHPTCSAYAIEAIELHGSIKGSWLAVRRIGRCHPFNPGGVDYVPDSSDARQYALRSCGPSA